MTIVVVLAGEALTAGLGLRSTTLGATLGIMISALVSGLTILIADDFLGFTKVADSSLGAGDGVAEVCA